MTFDDIAKLREVESQLMAELGATDRPGMYAKIEWAVRHHSAKGDHTAANRWRGIAAKWQTIHATMDAVTKGGAN